MRILHVNPTFGSLGGTEGYLHQLVRDQAARGHQPHVAAEGLVRLGPDDVAPPLYRLDDISTIEWTGREEESARRLREIVSDARAQVIHLHNVMNAALVKDACLLRPTIRFVHDHTLFCPGLNKEYADGGLCSQPMGEHCLERYDGAGCCGLRYPTKAEAEYRVKLTRELLDAHRSVDRFVVASRYMRSELMRAGIRRGRIAVIPLYAEAPPAAPVADSPPLVVTVCRMVHPDKGVATLLAALAAVHVPYRALLLGEGPDRGFFERLAQELGLRDTVEFLGAVPRARVLEILSGARVVAFPSMWNEPFGIVGLEALALARPVVAFQVGAVPEWLTPQLGRLVPRGDVAGFASALSHLLASPEEARALGRGGPKRVRRRFSKRAHLFALERTYFRARVRRGARFLLGRLWARLS